MPTFTVYKTDTIDTATGTALVSNMQSGQHFIHSVYVTNVYGSAMPITLEVEHSNGDVTNIAYNYKVFPNESVDLVKDNKIYLLTGDGLRVKAEKSDVFTVNASVLIEANQ